VRTGGLAHQINKSLRNQLASVFWLLKLLKSLLVGAWNPVEKSLGIIMPQCQFKYSCDTTNDSERLTDSLLVIAIPNFEFILNLPSVYLLHSHGISMALIEIDGLPFLIAWVDFPWRTVSHKQRLFQDAIQRHPGPRRILRRQIHETSTTMAVQLRFGAATGESWGIFRRHGDPLVAKTWMVTSMGKSDFLPIENG